MTDDSPPHAQRSLDVGTGGALVIWIETEGAVSALESETRVTVYSQQRAARAKAA